MRREFENERRAERVEAFRWAPDNANLTDVAEDCHGDILVECLREEATRMLCRELTPTHTITGIGLLRVAARRGSVSKLFHIYVNGVTLDERDYALGPDMHGLPPADMTSGLVPTAPPDIYDVNYDSETGVRRIHLRK
jgi:hypothetical protein